jgi:hypothetical protein
MPKRRPLTPAQRERKEAREIDRALNVIDRNVKARRKREQAEHAMLARIDARLKAAAGLRKKSKRPSKRAPKRSATKRPRSKKAPKRRPVELARARKDKARKAYDAAKTPTARKRARERLDVALRAYGEATRRAGF